MEELSFNDILRFLLYAFIFIAAISVQKTKKSKRKKNAGKVMPAGVPDASTSEAWPQMRPAHTSPKPQKKPQKQKKNEQETETRYFTYEDESTYELAGGAALRNENRQPEPQHIEKKDNAGEVEFDLRTAVIASEILKPKFDE